MWALAIVGNLYNSNMLSSTSPKTIQGQSGVARLYISKVTTDEERTTHVAILSLFQSLGFIMGPALNAALSFIGEKPIPATSSVTFDMFSAAA